MDSNNPRGINMDAKNYTGFIIAAAVAVLLLAVFISDRLPDVVSNETIGPEPTTTGSTRKDPAYSEPAKR